MVTIKNCSIDTNILVRWLVEDNAKQVKLFEEKLLLNKNIKTLYISDIVIVEMVWVLQKNYNLERSDIGEAIEIILNEPKFSLNRNLLEKVKEQYVSKPATSFADLMIVYYSSLNNQLPTFTFDKKMAKQIEGAELLI